MHEFINVDTGDNAATAFLFMGQFYLIVTSDVHLLRLLQNVVDQRYGYNGPQGNYETLLFRNHEECADLYPFGDLPGHQGTGVFQRYDTEEEARVGHQNFVLRVKKELRKRAKSSL